MKKKHKDLDFFTVLSAKLEIQSYYFMPQTYIDKNDFRTNAYRAYATAHNIIRLALKLEESQGFIKHAPHYIFRSVLDAVTIILEVISSPYGTDVDPAEGEALVKHSFELLELFSIEETDLPSRIKKMMVSCWSSRHLMTKAGNPVSEYPHRVGAVVTYDLLRRWKKELDKARLKCTSSGNTNGNIQGHGEDASRKCSTPQSRLVFLPFSTSAWFRRYWETVTGRRQLGLLSRLPWLTSPKHRSQSRPRSRGRNCE
jgi:transcriptional regulatory protein LEU3